MLLFLFLTFLADTEAVYVNEFMELGVGARALGMGNAFVGLADDPTAFYWNPAGLARLKSRALFLMHSEDFDGAVTTNTGAITYPTQLYTLGLGLYILSVPGIPLTDTTETGIIIDTAWVNASDYVAYLSYGRKFSNIDIGVNIKGIYRDWAIVTAYGFETDFGLLGTFKGVKYGLNFVNLIGTDLYWSDTTNIRDKIPLLIKSGVSVSESFSIGKISVALGFDTSPEKRVAQFTSLHTDTYLGAEYWWKDKFAIRSGFDKGIFTAGCGLIYRAITISYALKFHSDIGLLNRLSGSISF